MGSPHPVTVYTNHKNLKYYRHPQHINRRVACYIPRLADYNFTLVHLPGEQNKADALSRRPNLYPRDNDNHEVTVLSPSLFARATTFSNTDDHIREGQLAQPDDIRKWASTFYLSKTDDLYWYGDCLVVVDNLRL